MMMRLYMQFFGGRGASSSLTLADVAMSAAFRNFLDENPGTELISVNANDAERGTNSVETQAPKNSGAKQQLVKADTRSTDDEARKMYKGLRAFTDGDYSHMRAVTNGTFTGTDYDAAHFSNLNKEAEKYLSKAPRWDGGTVYRGIRIEEGNAKDIFKTGKVVDMKGMSSWSVSESTAKGFGHIGSYSSSNRNVLFVNDNTSGSYVGHVSVYDNAEHEVMCSSKARYEITKTVDHGTYLEVRVKEMLIK